MLHVTLLWPLPAALALGELSLRYFSDHAVICCILLHPAFKYFRRTAENTWCCLVLQWTAFFYLKKIETGPKLGAALDYFLVLAPLIQPDYPGWVGTSGFLDGCSLKILSVL